MGIRAEPSTGGCCPQSFHVALRFYHTIKYFFWLSRERQIPKYSSGSGLVPCVTPPSTIPHPELRLARRDMSAKSKAPDRRPRPIIVFSDHHRVKPYASRFRNATHTIYYYNYVYEPSVWGDTRAERRVRGANVGIIYRRDKNRSDFFVFFFFFARGKIFR